MLPLRQEGQEARGLCTPHPSPQAGTAAHRRGRAGHRLSVGARVGAGAPEGPGGGAGQAHPRRGQRPADSHGACKTRARPLTQASNLTRVPDPPWVHLLGSNTQSWWGFPPGGAWGRRRRAWRGSRAASPLSSEEALRSLNPATVGRVAVVCANTTHQSRGLLGFFSSPESRLPAHRWALRSTALSK